MTGISANVNRFFSPNKTQAQPYPPKNQSEACPRYYTHCSVTRIHCVSVDNNKPVTGFHSCITMHLCLSIDSHLPMCLLACVCISIDVLLLCVSVYLFTSVCSSVSCSTQGSVGYQCNWITSLSSCPGVC